MKKRALISVSDKTGIVEFAKKISELGYEIISTGGTRKKLESEGVNTIGISKITNFKECLDGRVKTLHPNVHAGLLAMRDNEDHMNQLKEMNIETIDMVVVNLYPFRETIMKDSVTLEEAIENIDIGGPTMLRSAAKNYKDVTVIVDPKDYNAVTTQIEENGVLSQEKRFELAYKVFAHTSNYDTLIANYLKEKTNAKQFDETVTMTYEKAQDLRYGENPFQKAAFYKEIGDLSGTLPAAEQLHGKELSFNNINDTNAAINIIKEFDEPTVVGLKHTNPCGVGSADTIYEAYMKSHKADPVSIFGGIIAANREINKEVAEEINKIFIEIVIAPSYSEEALQVLKQKKNIRILELKTIDKKFDKKIFEMKKVLGGLLIQEYNDELFNEEDLEVVTKTKPTKEQLEDLKFCMKLVKHAKSNAITLAKDKQSIGIGPGQVNRIGALKVAKEFAKTYELDTKGAVLASDAFFPFDDVVKLANEMGIKAIIQPGGSIRDKDSIEACDKFNIAMVFTGKRHFKH